MKFEDYERSERLRYQRLATVVEQILRHWLESASSMVAVPQLQSRAKDVGALRRKLEGRGLLGAEGIEAEIKDLAGCRVIFYTATDLDRFRQSDALRSLFEVDWSQSKIHYPGKDASDDELYQGIHYVVSLNAARADLVEYKSLAGLRCEIQLQTILKHAWSETSHEALYKARQVPGFGKALRDDIRKRFGLIMRKHLMEADYDLQRIQEDVERLEQGLKVFDGAPLDRLRNAADNNVRVDVLKDIRDHLLPGLDDVSQHVRDIRREVVSAIEVSRSAPVVPRQGALAGWRGATHVDVAKCGLEFLESVQYGYPDEAFAALVQLWEGTRGAEERKAVEAAVSRLAGFSFRIWERVGAAVQLMLTREILAMSEEKRALLRDVVLLVCEAVLGTEVDDIEAVKFDEVTFRRVGVRSNAALDEARDSAVRLGLAALEASVSGDDWRKGWKALWTGARSAGQDHDDDRLNKSQLELFCRLCATIDALQSQIPHDVRQEIEENLYRAYRRLTGQARGGKARSPNAVEQAAIDAALACRDSLNQDLDFVTYKTVVGFRTVFVEEWDHVGKARDKTAMRTARIDELAGQVSDATLDAWVSRIVQCAETQSNDMATFPPLVQFLKAVSARSPALALKMLHDGGKPLERFAPSLFPDLLRLPVRDDALASLAGWAEAGKNLAALGRSLLLCAEALPEITKDAAHRAIAGEDVGGCSEIATAAARHGTASNGLFDNALVPCVEMLNRKGVAGLASAVLLEDADWRKLSELPTQAAQAAIANFVFCPVLEHGEQARLAVMFGRVPELVWGMLEQRLKRAVGRDIADPFEAVPQSWEGLEKVLGADVVAVYDRISGWGDGGDIVQSWHKADLLAWIYHDCDAAFLAGMHAIVAREGAAAIPFMCEVLRHFDGDDRLDGLSQTMVGAVADGAPELDHVRGVIMASGVLHGEFGHAEMLEGKAKRLQSWLTHEDTKLVSFARAFIVDLERWALDERRRATEAHERQKRGFDRP